MRGSFTDLAALGALDVALDLSGQDLAICGSLVGLPLASTPPYRLAGRLVRADGVWRFDDFAGRIGDSDVAGRLVFTERPRRHLQVDVVSNRLDFDDLGPLIGAPPRTVGETASPEQRRQAQRMKETGAALPDKPLTTDRRSGWTRTRRLSGRRSFIRRRCRSTGSRRRCGSPTASCGSSRCGCASAGGDAIARVVLDGRAAPPRGTADVEFRSLKLGELFPTVEAMKKARGFAHGRARLAGTGDSVAALLGSADGRVSLAVDRGTISNLVLELLGLDVGESVLLFATGDKEIALHCAVADLGLAKGIGTTNVLVLDTADTLVVGAGAVDFRREQLDLTLYPRPKDKSLLAARAPLHVRGSLRDPVVRPDVSALAARGAGAAVLALINPLLALAAFIETGPGQDSECGRLVAAAKEWRAKAPAPTSERPIGLLRRNTGLGGKGNGLESGAGARARVSRSANPAMPAPRAPAASRTGRGHREGEAGEHAAETSLRAVPAGFFGRNASPSTNPRAAKANRLRLEISASRAVPAQSSASSASAFRSRAIRSSTRAISSSTFIVLLGGPGFRRAAAGGWPQTAAPASASHPEHERGGAEDVRCPGQPERDAPRRAVVRRPSPRRRRGQARQ